MPQPPPDIAPLVSDTVVVFPARRCAGHPADGYPDRYTKTISASDAGYDVTPPRASGAVPVFDTACALYSAPGGPPTNQNTLDILALQIAQDRADWRSVGFDTRYFGIVAPDPNALVDLVEWCTTAEEAWTRVASAPFNGLPEQYQHQDGAVADCTDPKTDGSQVVAPVPAVLFYGPGGSSSPTLSSLPRRTLAIERGRLVETVVQRDTPHCGCFSCATPATIRVTGCNNRPLPGAAVVILRDGTQVATGTTDSKGEFQFKDGTVNFLYTVNVSKDRFAAQSKDFYFQCDALLIFGLQPASGYHCCAYFVDPLRDTLRYTDANGTRLVSWPWQLGYNAPTPVTLPVVFPGSSCVYQAGTTPVIVNLCTVTMEAFFNCCIFDTPDHKITGWSPNGCSSFPPIQCLGYGTGFAQGQAIVGPNVTLVPPPSLLISGSWPASVTTLCILGGIGGTYDYDLQWPVQGNFTITE